MNRRNFLKSSSLLSVPLLLGGIPVAAITNPELAHAVNLENDRILVLVQLNGGNDGLSCVIPRDQQDNLAQVRSNILIPESNHLPITEAIAFHPNMGGMQQLFNDNKLAIVQGVGYENTNKSHFRSMDIWNTGSDAYTTISTGWLGRYLDTIYPNFPNAYPNETQTDPFALSIGNTVSETCEGVGGNFSFAVKDPTIFSQLDTPVQNENIGGCYQEKLEFLNIAINQTNIYGNVVQTAYNNGSNLSALYGEDIFANNLKMIARLISGGLQTKIYVVSLNGFDTHNAQVEEDNTTTGIHAKLLERLSDGIAAFQSDLRQLQLQHRVIGMTYSEFGRRIYSNASFGTDHGAAAPMFLFGTCVNAAIFGNNPIIDETVDAQTNLPIQFDFKTIYASILVDWFEVDINVVNTILMGNFPTLPILTPMECGPISPITQVIARVKIWLEAADDSNNMHTYLQNSNLLPFNQPYQNSPWFYSGNESISTVPTDMVDWLLIEILDLESSISVVSRRAVLLKNDGSVCDPITMETAIVFNGIFTGNRYHVAVRHRNHLGVVSRNPIDINGDELYDFTLAANMAMGENQLKELNNGLFALCAGDIDANGAITVADINKHLQELSNSNVYLPADVNMNGSIDMLDENMYQPNLSKIGVDSIRY
ncbi:MAG: DUF1501 domain-containing protein [Chitinophagales bacterium]